MHRVAIILVLSGSLLAGPAGADEAPIWLAVTKPMFVEALGPLAAARREQGFKTVISTKPPAEAIAALDRKPAFILLVGDDQPGQADQPWYLSAQRRQRYRWRATQEKEFATDAIWGDLDGDLVPDVPVGRLPVRQAAQAKRIVAKTVAYESRPPALADLRLPAWASAPEFNPVLDSLTTAVMLQTIRLNAPAWLRPGVVIADVRHSLCGWPTEQGKVFLDQYQRGGALAVLIGHAWTSSFHVMNFRERPISFRAAHAQAALAQGQPGPPLVLLTCLAGNFTIPGECLAESLLMMPAGPPVVIAATTESHPLPNYYSSVCLLRQLGEPQRIGSFWLAGQRAAMKTRNPLLEPLLRVAEGKLEEKINVQRLLADQMLLYALLGDPATRMHLPAKLHGKLRRGDDGWHWQVDRPAGATRLDVSFRPAGGAFPAPADPFEPAAARKNYAQADTYFAFNPITSLDTQAEWKGVIDKEGVLRLVATAPGRLYVAALRLTHPDPITAPAK